MVESRRTYFHSIFFVFSFPPFFIFSPCSSHLPSPQPILPSLYFPLSTFPISLTPPSTPSLPSPSPLLPTYKVSFFSKLRILCWQLVLPDFFYARATLSSGLTGGKANFYIFCFFRDCPRNFKRSYI